MQAAALSAVKGQRGNVPVLVRADYPAQGHAGRNIGKATLSFDASGALVGNAWELIAHGPEIPDDPEMAQWRATK